jgi:hypothetical protein
MLGRGFLPKPRPKLPLQMPGASLGAGFLNSPVSKAAKKKFIESVNSLAEAFGLSNVKTDFMSELIKFFGDSVKSQFDSSEAMGKHDRINLFSDVQAQSFPVNLPGHLSGKNLQDVLANNKSYKGLSPADGIALIQAIKAAVEQIDSTSSEILKWQKDGDSSGLKQYGVFNCTLLGFLMETVQGMPSQIKGIFTSGSDFHTWAMQTLADYEKSCKNQKKSPSFNVSKFKNEWNGLASKVDGWNNIDAKGLQSFASRPMMESTFTVRFGNQRNETQYKNEVKRWEMKKKEKTEKERQEKILEGKRAAKAKAAKTELQKKAWAKRQAKAKKA